MKPTKRQRREQRARDLALSGFRKDKDRQHYTAHHEAAHAVFNELFGAEVKEVLVQPHFDKKDGRLTLGFCSADVVVEETKEYYVRRVLVSLAGPSADQKFWQEELHAGKIRNQPPMSGSDQTQIYNYFEQMGLKTREEKRQAFKEYVKKTREILEIPEVWITVEAVASWVLDGGKINGDKVRAVMRSGSIYRDSVQQAINQIVEAP